MKNVKIAESAVIEDDVEIGEGTVIKEGVIIRSGTRIGKNNIIFPYAVIGEEPQDLRFRGERSGVIIGDGNIIREFVTIHRAAGEGENTIIGNGNYLMAYVHVGHNARIGNGAILVNGATLGGYAEVHDHAYISANVAVHQFTRVGEYAIVGGGFRVTKDVIPYALAAGEPLRIYGVNFLGLRRCGFSQEKREIIKEAIRILTRMGLNTSQAVECIRRELPDIEEIRKLLRFIETSKRGIAK
ncbi:acyl-[acyl-carrier-protein]--UDP-N-acetylglucosamine O-acyltransferase [bacterium]|nr:MAG: acyl-[acyl-carrier-protein]--UDP-N-acetylglucosamine O-acyltransferase [bacterium]